MKFKSCAFFIFFSFIVNFVLADEILPYTDSKIIYEGRVDINENDGLGLYWPGTSIKAKFIGTEIWAEMQDFSTQNANYYYVLIDGQIKQKIKVEGSSKQYYLLAYALNNQEHTVELIKLNHMHEGYQRSFSKFHNLKIVGVGEFLSISQSKVRKIEFYGNSITAGLSAEWPVNNTDNTDGQYENNYITYAARTARYFNAQYSCIAKSGIGLMVSTTLTNMPLMYDKINPLDNSRLWDFNQYQPDIVVVNLLQNDASIISNPSGNQTAFNWAFPGGAPTDQDIVNAYKAFISQLRSKYPNANIICTLGSMSAVNPSQNGRWKNYITTAATELNDNKVYVNFYAYRGVAGHPKANDNEQMAQNLICFIKCNNLFNP